MEQESASWYSVENLRSIIQYGVLMVTMSTVPILSMIASSGIMYMIHRKGLLDSVLRRLLFALSLSDFCLSLSLIWNVWLLPKGTPGAYWAFGNHTTCQTMGFISFSLGMVTSFINCILSLYFLVSVRYGMSDALIAKRYERTGYAVVLVFPLTTGIGGIVTRSFNPQEFIGVCQWDVYPWGCEDNPDLECTGEYSIILGWVSMFLLFASSMTGFVAVYLVYRAVRRRVRVTRQYNDFSTQSTDEMMQRSRRVKVQAILYSAVYFNSFIWPAAAGLVGEMIDPGRYASFGPYLLVFLCYLFYPLQGLGNFCVYIYPSVQRWRRSEPELSLTSVVWRILQGQKPRLLGRGRGSSGSMMIDRQQFHLRSSLFDRAPGAGDCSAAASCTTTNFVKKATSRDYDECGASSQRFASDRLLTVDTATSVSFRKDDSDRYSVVNSSIRMLQLSEDCCDEEDEARQQATTTTATTTTTTTNGTTKGPTSEKSIMLPAPPRIHDPIDEGAQASILLDEKTEPSSSVSTLDPTITLVLADEYPPRIDQTLLTSSPPAPDDAGEKEGVEDEDTAITKSC